MAASNIIDPICNALRAVRGVASAYLFGSMASGRQHRESDVDVAVRLDRSTYPTAVSRFHSRLDLIPALQRASGRDVDLVILNDAPPQLARDIMTRGTKLLVVDDEQEHAWLCVTLSRAADIEPFLQRARAVKLRTIAP